MSAIDDSTKLMYLTLSWISPCSLETPEGIALKRKKEEAQGSCEKAGCPFSWYCETIAGTALTAAQDLAELTMGPHMAVTSKSTMSKAEGCRNLVLKAFKEIEKADLEEKKMSLALTIRNLSLEEVKELMRHVRRIEQENPDRLVFCWIHGLEDKTKEEALKILLEVFPRVEVGG